MKTASKSDRDLQNILDSVRLGYLPSREGGWDTKKDWANVFSGGERQRMAFARLMYHEPHYAFIDEGTSAVSSDVEGLLYETAKERGITLITISTRAQLKKYHTYQLRLGTGSGNEWEFDRIGAARERMSNEAELKDLEKKLQMVSEWERRKEEIDRELQDVLVQGGGRLEDVEKTEQSADATQEAVESGAEVEIVPVLKEEEDEGSRGDDVAVFDDEDVIETSEEPAEQPSEQQEEQPEAAPVEEFPSPEDDPMVPKTTKPKVLATAPGVAMPDLGQELVLTESPAAVEETATAEHT